MSISSIAGLLFAPAGLAVGVFLTIMAIGSGYYIFMIAAPVAAFITAKLFWYLLVQRSKSVSKGMAVLSGLLSGLFSHYVCWYILLTGEWVLAFISGENNSYRELINPLTAFAAAGVYSAFSLLFFGLFTIPFGIISALVTNNIAKKRL